jgi:transcriptional regulator with XRE-family HTH domain
MNNTEKYFLLRFGRQLAAKRKELCLTQKEFAKLVGISPAYIASIESGRRWPRLVVHHAIADTLHIEVAELLKGLCFEPYQDARKLRKATVELRP